MNCSEFTNYSKHVKHLYSPFKQVWALARQGGRWAVYEKKHIKHTFLGEGTHVKNGFKLLNSF